MLAAETGLPPLSEDAAPQCIHLTREYLCPRCHNGQFPIGRVAIVIAPTIVNPDSDTVSAPQKAAPQTSSAGRSACELFREAIDLGISKGRNAEAIWQDLVDSSGFAGGYQSVKRFIRNLRGTSSPEACAVIETAPGEECQGDYGSGPLVRVADSGKY